MSYQPIEIFLTPSIVRMFSIRHKSGRCLESVEVAKGIPGGYGTARRAFALMARRYAVVGPDEAAPGDIVIWRNRGPAGHAGLVTRGADGRLYAISNSLGKLRIEPLNLGQGVAIYRAGKPEPVLGTRAVSTRPGYLPRSVRRALPIAGGSRAAQLLAEALSESEEPTGAYPEDEEILSNALRTMQELTRPRSVPQPPMSLEMPSLPGIPTLPGAELLEQAPPPAAASVGMEDFAAETEEPLPAPLQTEPIEPMAEPGAGPEIPTSFLEEAELPTPDEYKQPGEAYVPSGGPALLERTLALLDAGTSERPVKASMFGFPDWLTDLLFEARQAGIRRDIHRLINPGAPLPEEEELEPQPEEEPEMQGIPRRPGRFSWWQRALLILGTPQRLIAQFVMRNTRAFREEPELKNKPFMRRSTLAWLKHALWPTEIGDEETFIDAFLARARRTAPDMYIQSPVARTAIAAIAGLALDIATDPLSFVGFGARVLGRSARDIALARRAVGGARIALPDSSLLRQLRLPERIGQFRTHFADLLLEHPEYQRLLRAGGDAANEAARRIADDLIPRLYTDEEMAEIGSTLQRYLSQSPEFRDIASEHRLRHLLVRELRDPILQAFQPLRPYVRAPLRIFGIDIPQAAELRDRARIALGLPGIDYTLADMFTRRRIQERMARAYEVLFRWRPLELWESEWQRELLPRAERLWAKVQEARGQLQQPAEVARKIGERWRQLRDRLRPLFPSLGLPRHVYERLSTHVNYAKSFLRQLHGASERIFRDLSPEEDRAMTFAHYLYRRALEEGFEHRQAMGRFRHGVAIALHHDSPEQAAASLMLYDITMRPGGLTAIEPWEQEFIRRHADELLQRLQAGENPFAGITAGVEGDERVERVARAYETLRSVYDQIYQHIDNVRADLERRGIQMPMPAYRHDYFPLREQAAVDELRRTQQAFSGTYSPHVPFTRQQRIGNVVEALAFGKMPIVSGRQLFDIYSSEVYRWLSYADIVEILREATISLDNPPISIDRLRDLGAHPVFRLSAPFTANPGTVERWASIFGWNPRMRSYLAMPELYEELANLRVERMALRWAFHLLGLRHRADFREASRRINLPLLAETVTEWLRGQLGIPHGESGAEDAALVYRAVNRAFGNALREGGIHVPRMRQVPDVLPEALTEYGQQAMFPYRLDAVQVGVLNLRRAIRTRLMSRTREEIRLLGKINRGEQMLEQLGMRGITMAIDTNFIGRAVMPDVWYHINHMFRESETTRLAKILADFAMIPFMRANLLLSIGFHVRNFIDNWIAGRFISGELIRSFDLRQAPRFWNDVRDAITGSVYHFFFDLPLLPPEMQRERIPRIFRWALERIAGEREDLLRIVREAQQHGVLSTGFTALARESAEASTPMAKLREVPVAGVYAKLLEWNTALGQFLENVPRLATFIHYRRAGYSAAEAARKVATAYPIYQREIYNPVMAVAKEFTTFLPWWESRTRQIFADAYANPWKYNFLIRAYGAATQQVQWNDPKPLSEQDQFLFQKALRGRYAYLRSWIPIPVRFDENGNISGRFGRVLEKIVPNLRELGMYQAGQSIDLLGQRIPGEQLPPRVWMFIRPALSPVEVFAALEQILDGDLSPLKDLLSSPIVSAGEVLFEWRQKPGARGLGERLTEAAKNALTTYMPLPTAWRAWRYHARPSLEELSLGELYMLQQMRPNSRQRALLRLMAHDAFGEKAALRSILSWFGLSITFVPEIDLVRNLPRNMRDEWLQLGAQG